MTVSRVPWEVGQKEKSPGGNWALLQSSRHSVLTEGMAGAWRASGLHPWSWPAFSWCVCMCVNAILFLPWFEVSLGPTSYSCTSKLVSPSGYGRCWICQRGGLRAWVLAGGGVQQQSWQAVRHPGREPQSAASALGQGAGKCIHAHSRAHAFHTLW